MVFGNLNWKINMTTNLYFALRGNFKEKQEKLASWSKEFLESVILDSEYNQFMRDWADKENDHGCGKRIPYIGWYWRHVEFSGDIPIGDCGEFIGFMVNNKWDHPERYLDDVEKMEVIRIIDEAMYLNQQGGLGSEILKNVEGKLEELWDYMQTLKIA